MTEKFYDEERFADISENLKAVRYKIGEAALRSGRAPKDIDLMAVTKTVGERYINHAISCGVTLIGENRVQELLRKKTGLHLDGVRKNLIGHLQTNKVSQIAGEVDMIESVDSLKIAGEIGRRSVEKGLVTDVLLEVNIGLEASKTGFSPSAVGESVCELAAFPGIRVRGLMAIPPVCEKISELCKFFENMYRMYVDIAAKKIDNISMDVLSMGMSGDYETAILEGSNHVRIGTGIFGPRIY